MSEDLLAWVIGYLVGCWDVVTGHVQVVPDDLASPSLLGYKQAVQKHG